MISDLASISVNGTWTGTCFLGCSATFTGDFGSDGNFEFSHSTGAGHGPMVAQVRIETSQDGQIIAKDVSPGDITGELETDTFFVKARLWSRIE